MSLGCLEDKRHLVEDLFDKAATSIGGEAVVIFTEDDPNKKMLSWLQEHNPLHLISIDAGKVSIGAEVQLRRNDENIRLFVFVVPIKSKEVSKE